ncbi:phage tail tape measure protein [Serratia quinivorans]|uniref:phage tail tape measure protein n=1 Tax=Serratia quinivorans TaxID=137545 RepID=UPI002179C7C5|nr:phage tail tape measure protein [Serratia quinivorans]CAI1510180.1 Phage-related minor tail protein [Serratia quinivorans]CAI1576907.1 Phage-related minor tail protein [Serratia quinivorans]
MSKSLQLQVLLKAVDQATRPLKSIQQASKTLAGDIKTTQQTLKALDAQAARIEGFRKQQAQLAVTGQALKTAKAEAAALAVQFKATEKPTAQQARLLAASKRAAAELQTKYNGLRQSVQRQRNALNADGIATKKLSAEQRRLKASASEATAALNRQRAELGRLSKKQESLSRIQQRAQAGKALGATVRNQSAVGLGVATAGLYAESRFMAPGVQFDKQMSDTQATLGLAKNDKQLTAIRQQARDIGATTAFSPTDVARTQSVLAKSGFNGDAILKSTESTVNLALASDLDIADAADIITNMQSAFNMPIDEIQRVADVMTKGFTSSNSNLMDFGEAMKYVAPIAEAAGASIEDTTALLGVLADNGIKGSMAGTATSAMFTRLQAPVGQAQDALSELGVKTKDGKGNMLPIEGILKKIDRSFKKNKLGTAQQAEYLKVIFGEEAMKGAIKLIAAAGNGKLGAKKQTVTDSKGATEHIAKTKTDNLDGDLKNMSSAFEDIQIEVFDKQDSGLRQLTQSATKWLGVAGQWAKENPELSGTLFKLALGLTAAIGAMAVVGFLAAPVITTFSLLMVPTRGLTKGLFKLGKIATKFSFKGITTAARGLGTVMKFTGGVVGRSLLTMGGGMLKLMSIVGRVSFTGLVKSLRFVGTAVMWLGRIMMANPILAVISLVAMGAIYIWQNWETLGPKFQAVWETVKNATLGAWDGITTATSAAWERVKQSTKAAWEGLKTWLGGQWDDLVGAAKALPGKFKEAGMNMINGIIDGISERWQALKDKFSGLTDMLPDWMKFGGDKTEINPAISYNRPAPELAPGPGYAGAFDKGGNIPRGQFGIVGERGPEVVGGPVNVTGRRKTAALSAAMLSLSTPVMASAPPAAPVQMAPAPITIQVHAAPGQDAQAIAREVSRQLAAEQRKQAAAARSRMNYGG